MEFLCPNGHRLRCRENQVGKAAKCPKCGMKFRIPHPQEPGAAEPRVGDLLDFLAEAEDSPSDSGRGRGFAPAAKEQEIEFLCPNGHRLHGAASLQGRPGLCPQCGAKFRIPVYEEVTEEESTEQTIGVGPIVGRPDSNIGIPTAEELESASRLDLAAPLTAGGASSASGKGLGDSPRAPVPSLATLIAKLWREKDAGGTLEFDLTNGETFQPDRFSPKNSQLAYGLFMVKESNDTFTAHAIRWDTITRIRLRGLKEIPRDLAD